MDQQWHQNSLPAGLSLVIALVAIIVPRYDFSAGRSCRLVAQWQSRRHERGLVQANDADENEVSTDDVDKYVAVYKAMQRNRSLTVDQAAAAQGLTTRQFRELENRVQRDEAALQQARDELQAAAQSSPSANGRSLSSHP